MWICDIGKALEHIGSVSEEDCVPCVPGTVNGQDGMLNCGECQSSTEFAIEEGEAAVDKHVFFLFLFLCSSHVYVCGTNKQAKMRAMRARLIAYRLTITRCVSVIIATMRSRSTNQKPSKVIALITLIILITMITHPNTDPPLGLGLFNGFITLRLSLYNSPNSPNNPNNPCLELDPEAYAIYMETDFGDFDPNQLLGFWCAVCPEGADCYHTGMHVCVFYCVCTHMAHD